MDKLQQAQGEENSLSAVWGHRGLDFTLIPNPLSGGYCHFDPLISVAGAHQLLSPASQKHFSFHHSHSWEFHAWEGSALNSCKDLRAGIPAHPSHSQGMPQVRDEQAPVFILCLHKHKRWLVVLCRHLSTLIDFMLQGEHILNILI